jgi:hypothetical protein
MIISILHYILVGGDGQVKRSLTYELAAINKSPPPHRRTRINAVHSHQQHQLEQLAAGRRKKRSRVTVAATSATMPSKTTKETSSGLIYLIPLHGGIFSLCIDLESKSILAAIFILVICLMHSSVGKLAFRVNDVMCVCVVQKRNKERIKQTIETTESRERFFFSIIFSSWYQ